MSQVVEERRAARIGTVSGLALLVGGTAVIAVTGGTHSIFATLLLGMLTIGMAYGLLDEVRRQARRRSARGWDTPDTVNTALLALWAVGALVVGIMVTAPTQVRVVAVALAVQYALTGTYFVVERRRSILARVGDRTP